MECVIFNKDYVLDLDGTTTETAWRITSRTNNVLSLSLIGSYQSRRPTIAEKGGNSRSKRIPRAFVRTYVPAHDDLSAGRAEGNFTLLARWSARARAVSK